MFEINKTVKKLIIRSQFPLIFKTQKRSTVGDWLDSLFKKKIPG